MQQPNFNEIFNKLHLIQDGIINGLYADYKGDNAVDGWAGADIAFTTKAPPKSNSNFYPNPREVVTRYAHAAGWLLSELWKLFSDQELLDGCSKIEFFGRLANAAIRYQKSLNGLQETAMGLLNAIFDESKKILHEMSNGEFEYLTVASGNMIAKDLKL